MPSWLRLRFRKVDPNHSKCFRVSTDEPSKSENTRPSGAREANERPSAYLDDWLLSSHAS